MRIVAVPVKAKELKPGDLYSMEGPAYWDDFGFTYSMGEKLYIRTFHPCPLDEEEKEVYRIEIREGE